MFRSVDAKNEAFPVQLHMMTDSLKTSLVQKIHSMHCLQCPVTWVSQKLPESFTTDESDVEVQTCKFNVQFQQLRHVGHMFCWALTLVSRHGSYLAGFGLLAATVVCSGHNLSMYIRW